MSQWNQRAPGGTAARAAGFRPSAWASWSPKRGPGFDPPRWAVDQLEGIKRRSTAGGWPPTVVWTLLYLLNFFPSFPLITSLCTYIIVSVEWKRRVIRSQKSRYCMSGLKLFLLATLSVLLIGQLTRRSNQMDNEHVNFSFLEPRLPKTTYPISRSKRERERKVGQ
jgi:hypothetical protein